MREKMQIILDDMERYQESYALWSVLFVRVKDICFPSHRWYDATSAVLSIWQQEIIRLISGSADCVRLPFMDGDYEIVLTRSDHEIVSAKLLMPDALAVWEGELDFIYFSRQLLSAVGKLRAYYSNNLDSPQMRELSSLADRLRITMKEATVN